MDIKLLSSSEPSDLTSDSISYCRYNLRNRGKLQWDFSMSVVHLHFNVDFSGSTMFTALAESECPICLSDVFDKPVVVNCGHTFCRECIRSSMAKYKNCPMCNQVLIEALFLSDLRFTRKLSSSSKLQVPSAIETNKIQNGKNTSNRKSVKPKPTNNQKKSVSKPKKSRTVQ